MIRDMYNCECTIVDLEKAVKSNCEIFSNFAFFRKTKSLDSSVVRDYI